MTTPAELLDMKLEDDRLAGRIPAGTHLPSSLELDYVLSLPEDSQEECISLLLLPCAALRSKCKEKGLKTTGVKLDLVSRLCGV
jgi:hypothetical protein